MGLEAVQGGVGYAGEEDMEDMVLLKRCTKLLERLTPRHCPHPDTAVARMKLGNMWWQLHLRGRSASLSCPRPTKSQLNRAGLQEFRNLGFYRRGVVAEWTAM